VLWQNDYCFVSQSLSATVKACYVVDDGQPEPWAFSDHCPLVLDLILTEGD
jgi:exonuclease III